MRTRLQLDSSLAVNYKESSLAPTRNLGKVRDAKWVYYKITGLYVSHIFDAESLRDVGTQFFALFLRYSYSPGARYRHQHLF